MCCLRPRTLLRVPTTAFAYNQAKHMEHLILVVRAGITNMLLFIQVAPPELEHNAITNHLLDWNRVQLANIIHDPQ